MSSLRRGIIQWLLNFIFDLLDGWYNDKIEHLLNNATGPIAIVD